MNAEKKKRRAVETRLFTKAMRSFLVTYRSWLEDDLRGHGFNLAQLRLLYAVKEKVGVANAELARVCEVRPQTIQALLLRAERQGWITRSKSKMNDRIVLTHLTEEGESVLALGTAAAEKIEEPLFQNLKTSEVIHLREQLESSLAQARIARGNSPQQ